VRALAALTLLLALAGCAAGDRVSTAPDGAASTPVVTPPNAAEPAPRPDLAEEGPRAAVAAFAPDQEVTVPAGVLQVGSRPGNPLRDPRREADLVPITVPSFRIDRFPYPNDPNRSPETGLTRDEAGALCAAEGKRLCNELEWERACKGDTTRDYPGGPLRDVDDIDACRLDPAQCASPYGVVDLGVSTFEWTSSDVTRGLGSTRYSAVVRGGRPEDPLPEHRCAARHALEPAVGDGDTSFRCCRAAAPELAYPAEESRHAFRDRPLEEPELRRILASIPELARFAPRFSLFDAEAVDEALARGESSRESISWTIAPGVLAWSPEHGEEAWVFAGSDGESTVLAVIHPMPDGSFVHGSSFIIAGEEAPSVAIAWDYGQRRQVLWGLSWGETGESGVFEHRDDHRIVIVQR